MMESEIKLSIDASSVARIKKLPLLREHADGAPREQEHIDRYFDTADFDLWKNGYALRVRTAGGRHVQTLKGGGTVVAGLHRRTELESEIPDATPDIALFEKQLREALPSLAKHWNGRALDTEPVFVNVTKRTTWMLALPDGVRIECALDIGELRRGERTKPVRELELEVKEGDPTRLYELASQVHLATPVRIENASKAERGYALAKAGGSPAVKATAVTLKRKASLGDALGSILINCLQQMQANEQGVIAGDVESLHQMRVGLRRLRAAQAMVRDLIQLPEPLPADIEWLAGELGDARNWDVFVETVLQGVQLPDELQPSATRLEAAAQQEAERHRARVRTAVTSPRYTTVILSLAGWIAGKGWQIGEAHAQLGRKTAKAAPQLVRKAATRLRKRARSYDLKLPECMHKVRIAAKKERYAREFFASLDDARKNEKRRDLLTHLQDELGEINDTFVARGLIGELRQRVPQEETLLGFIDGVLTEKALQALPRARKHIKQRLRAKVRQ
jgi:triphosphatase